MNDLPSNINFISNKINEYESEYKTISKIKEGEKLEVNAEKHLGISGSAFSRTWANLTGTRDATWKGALGKIHEINENSLKYLKLLADHPFDQRVNDMIQRLYVSIQNAEQGLDQMKNSSYSNNPNVQEEIETLKKELNGLITRINNLSSQTKNVPTREITKEKKQVESEEEQFDNEEFTFLSKKVDFAEGKGKEIEIEESLDEEFTLLPNKVDLAEEDLAWTGTEFKVLDEALHDIGEEKEKITRESLNETLTLPVNLEEFEKNFIDLSSKSREITDKKLENSLNQFMQTVRPLLNDIEVKESLMNLVDCYGEISYENLPITSPIIHLLCSSIDKKLKEQYPDQGKEYIQKKELLRDILLVTAFPVVINQRPLKTLTPDRLIALLKEINENPNMDDILAVVGPHYFGPQINTYQRLLLLSHLSISDRTLTASLLQQPLFQKIYDSLALPLFLAEAKIHVPQTYRQTCVGTSYNMYFQRLCGTIAELIELSKIVIQQAQTNLINTPAEKLNELAYNVNFGTAPTKKQYAEQVINVITKQITLLEEKALKLAEQKNVTAQQIAELTREWNFATQYLETVIDPLHPVIVNTQVFPDAYKLSAVLSGFATGMTSIFPGQPQISSRWRHSIQASELDPINQQIFNNGSMRSVLKDPYDYDLIAAIDRGSITMNAIWESVQASSGGLLHFISKRLGGGGHTVFIESAVLEDERIFLLFDPMQTTVKKFSQEQFKDYLDKQNSTNLISIRCPKK